MIGLSRDPAPRTSYMDAMTRDATTGTGFLPGLRRAATMPFWAAQLLTGAKSFMDNPLIGSRALNERGLHTARIALAHRLATRRRRRLEAAIDPADREAFARDGFVVKRDALPRSLFEELRDQVQAHRGTVREHVQGDTTTRRMAVDRAALAAMPALAETVRRPVWRDLVRFVGSADATPMLYLQTILSHSYPGAPDPQTHLHTDTFHPTVKAWLFLTDVAPDEGPFTYVPGSHLATPARLAWEEGMSLDAARHPDHRTRLCSFRVEEAELPGLGLPPPVAFAVPANTLVVADTHGFHARGPSVRPSVRVELWAYGRRNPFIPWTGLDLAALSGLAPLRPRIFWGISDAIARMGLGHQYWRPRAGVSAFDGPG